MTSSIDVKMGEKVLEIGTGSAISRPISRTYRQGVDDRDHQAVGRSTRGVYDALIPARLHRIQGYQFQIRRRLIRLGEAAPFDKIIVTCGIDHIPPPLLQQLKPGGSW